MNKFFKILFSIFFVLSFETSISYSEETKIKIGVLAPLSGEDESLGKQILNSIRMALIDIKNSNIEIYPKDTRSDPDVTLRSALEFEEMGISLVIGPVFHKNLLFLDKVKNITFLSLTNKTLDLHKNIISSGINSSSQLKTIKKFLEKSEIKKTILLIPNLNYGQEVKKGIKDSNIKFFKQYNYNIDPTKLTKQIEKITNYGIRKQNLLDEISRVENSDDPNKEKIIENLEKKYTLGNVKFDSVVVADFDESLKSVITSLLYTDVSPKKKYIITLNQWFDESLLKERNLQPIYYPSINKQNLDQFTDKFFKKFNYKPNYLSLLSYDLVGLIYYLSLKNEALEINKSFKTQNTFKGKIGVFEIKDNKINHQLNFYQINDGKLIEIF
ncbi:ABC transporter substrate-binding protein [Candidatus Pelagibacter sp.]|uniref:ABC transporter substrate-binding protein n=1 Tax=Candidatus Pelagibacter sp. TaxID=2024849 RepID=UPI003F84E8D9